MLMMIVNVDNEMSHVAFSFEFQTLFLPTLANVFNHIVLDQSYIIQL